MKRKLSFEISWKNLNIWWHHEIDEQPCDIVSPSSRHSRPGISNNILRHVVCDLNNWNILLACSRSLTVWFFLKNYNCTGANISNEKNKELSNEHFTYIHPSSSSSSMRNVISARDLKLEQTWKIPVVWSYANITRRNINK